MIALLLPPLTSPPVQALLHPELVSATMIQALGWYNKAPARRPRDPFKKSTHRALLDRTLIDEVGGRLTDAGKREWRKHRRPARPRAASRRGGTR